ncbi:MAG TPA: DUF2939 domain-containing protein [Longimicrobium sp.]|nr:DUF2939 domain-containing protein [Longimicrobium sp.]
MNKRIILVAVPVLVLGAAAAGWTYHYRGTPQYSLKQAANAVKAKDRAAFQKYVAVDSVVSGAVDELLAKALEETRKEAAAGDDGFAALGAELAAGLIQGIKPMVVTELRNGIMEGVEQGDLGKAFEADSATEDAGLDLADAGAQPMEYAGMDVVSREGRTARADLRLRRTDLDQTFPLRLRLAQRDGYWQVMAVENVVEFSQAIDQAESRRLAEVNRPVLAELAKLARVDSLRGSHESDEWGFESRVTFAARLTNTGPQPLQEVRVEAGEGADRIVLTHAGPVPPGQSVTVASSAERLRATHPIHSRVGRGRNVPLDAPMRLTSARVGGRVVAAHDDWAAYVERERPKQ